MVSDSAKKSKSYYLYICLFLIVVLASFLRLHNIPDRPFGNDVWLWTIGFNLHKTAFLNIQAHVTENFFKSLVYPPYGWSDTLPMYIASGIYTFFKIPLNEFWICFVHSFLAITSVVLIFILGRLLFNKIIGLIAAAIFAILPIDTFVFGSRLLYHHNFLIFSQLILLISLIYSVKRKTLFSLSFFSLSLFLNAGTENILVLPFVLLFQYILKYQEKRLPAFSLKNFFKFIFAPKTILPWIPVLFILFLHLYIYSRLGESNLGLLGYVLPKYGSSMTLSGIISSFITNAKVLYSQFFQFYLIFVIILCFLYILAKKKAVDLNFAGLVAWVVGIFFIHVYLKQSKSLAAFRYSHYFVPLILVSAYVSAYIFEYVSSLRMPDMFKKYIRVFVFVTLLGSFFYNVATALSAVITRKIYSSPIKAASFYTRKYGNNESTIFQLIPSHSSYNFRGEYYFGKCYMEPGDDTGALRQLFSFGNHTIDEYRKAYNLKDFDFYILYHDNSIRHNIENKIDSFLNDASDKHIKKVADIKRNGVLETSIYSPLNLSYAIIDAGYADRRWDNEYANLKNLLQNRYCGLAVLWGYHHRLN